MLIHRYLRNLSFPNQGLLSIAIYEVSLQSDDYNGRGGDRGLTPDSPVQEEMDRYRAISEAFHSSQREG